MSETTLERLDAAHLVAGQRSTYALMQLFADFPDEIEQAVTAAITAARALREARGSIHEEHAEADFESAVLDVAELGIGASR